jgi:phosphoketolase
MNDWQDQWRKGLGVIAHRADTRERVAALVEYLDITGQCPAQRAWRLFAAADRLASMGLWLTAHMTYARQVSLDGRALAAADFKPVPEGHTGGALNIVPAYVGYLLANALTGKTRAWVMGQGHCVAAIDAVNVLTRNLEPEQDERYPLSDEGLSRLCQDFYSYEIGPDGRPAAPLGSHVNVHTAGGISEGGYLGFAGLQYVHMPLPGQELVSFLSDGAFEEQRGSDWAARWWRGEDTGLVMPIMIANGRRIDQRTTMSQSGGVHWFREHLQLNGFEPIDIDGRDPAAFAWAIVHMAERLTQQHEAIKDGLASYPVLLPYAIAETVKGYGFPGAGTNAAHNLPLPGSGATDELTRTLFNEGCAVLHVPPAELQDAIATLQTHAMQQRVLERDHCLRKLQVSAPVLPEPQDIPLTAHTAPMAAIDEWVCALALANPQKRMRVGNPDEMRSNRMNKTLDLLQHRVTSPEKGVAESLQGAVITALNEEAVISAALANKQGLSLAVSYEAFAVKMLGAMRQEVIFARHTLETGRAVEWVSVPVLVSSHTWENGKNEQSHQDPTLCEAWLGEMADVAPVYFPFDANSAVAVVRALFGTRGRVATVVAAKNVGPQHCTAAQAQQAVRDGALLLRHETNAPLQLLALGSYQLQACLEAADVLQAEGIRCSVVAIVEPGRFRIPRDAAEADYAHDDAALAAVIPAVQRRLFVSHTHAEVMTGVLRRLDTGRASSHFMGYRNRGGTLDVAGMQFANGQSVAHILTAARALLSGAVA